MYCTILPDSEFHDRFRIMRIFKHASPERVKHYTLHESRRKTSCGNSRTATLTTISFSDASKKHARHSRKAACGTVPPLSRISRQLASFEGTSRFCFNFHFFLIVFFAGSVLVEIFFAADLLLFGSFVPTGLLCFTGLLTAFFVVVLFVQMLVVFFVVVSFVEAFFSLHVDRELTADSGKISNCGGSS